MTGRPGLCGLVFAVVSLAQTITPSPATLTQTFALNAAPSTVTVS